MRTKRLFGLFLLALFLSGCTSHGNLGIVTRSAEDPAQLMKSGRAFLELGPAEGEACKKYFLGMIPWGTASIAIALDNALKEKAGDALIDVTVESSLYFSPPPYFLFTKACNTLKGTLIKFQ